MRVGNCSKCGGDAAYNTPFVNHDGELFCEHCASESAVLLRGVEQHLTDGGAYTEDQLGCYVKNHCLLCTKRGVMGYTDDGRCVFKLTEYEKELAVEEPETILDLMAKIRASGKYRCSSCGVEMREAEVGAFPLFAGVICRKCFVEYNRQIEEERREGKICEGCKQPFTLCCC